MFTFNIHELLNRKKKAALITPEIMEDYKIWEETYEEVVGKKPSLEESFYAGYLIGNNVFLKERIIAIRRSNQVIKSTFEN